MKAKKIIIVVLVLSVLVLGGWALSYNFNKNAAEIETFETTQAHKTDIKTTAMATGEVKPRETIEIKPNISGVISQIAVKEGDLVKNGQLIASIKVVPNVASLNSAKQQINSAQIEVDNQTRNFNRQKGLYEQGVIAKAEYETALASYNSALQNLRTAQNNYQVEQTGIAPGLEKYATTQIRSTIEGMILDIPVEIGDNVQEINNFSTGTTIAEIANVQDMIFEGKVDEADVGKLKEGMDIAITIGALPDETFNGKLDFISPSGVEENGVVQFEIEASVQLKEDVFVRAGYSANAEVVTDNKQNVLALKESEIQYDENGKAFVEIQKGNDEWERKNLRLGISNGVDVEILEGISANDKVKIWNTDLKEESRENRPPPRR